MPLLELENVVAAYGKVEALKGLTLRVEQGEIVALLGSNGAGKSTTLRTISGLMRPLSGTMRFLGQPIERLSPEGGWLRRAARRLYGTMTRYAPRISAVGSREIEKSSFVLLCESLAHLFARY